MDFETKSKFMIIGYAELKVRGQLMVIRVKIILSKMVI